jgi:hypothetical protein
LKLYWKDEEKTSLLLTEPAAKLLSILKEDGRFTMVCLSHTLVLKVNTLEEAKRLSIVKLQSIIGDLYNTLLDIQ